MKRKESHLVLDGRKDSVGLLQSQSYPAVAVAAAAVENLNSPNVHQANYYLLAHCLLAKTPKMVGWETVPHLFPFSSSSMPFQPNDALFRGQQHSFGLVVVVVLDLVFPTQCKTEMFLLLPIVLLES